MHTNTYRPMRDTGFYEVCFLLAATTEHAEGAP